LALAAIVWLQPAPASAQRVAGPYEGLFGAGPARQGTGQSLELRGSLFGSWDDVMMTSSDRLVTPAAQEMPATDQNSFLAANRGAGAQGGLQYLRYSDAVRFLASGNSEVRVYPEADNFTASLYGADTSLDLDLGSRVVIRATGSGTYSSFYQFAPFLDAETGGVGPLETGFNFASSVDRNARIAIGTGAVVTLTRRSTFAADADWSEWRFLDRADSTVETRGARGTVGYQLTRALSLRAGYGFQEGQYNIVGVEPATLRTIDVGVDYGDTLEFARRTALRFGTRTSAVNVVGETHYRVEGSAVLSRGFRRTWSTAVAYERTTSFTPGFPAPILSDSVNADIGGLVNRRVRWATGAGYSRGSIGFGDSGNFATYTGASRFQFALTERLGLYGQYAYYRYRVPAGSTAAESVPRFARQTATAGLTLWLPIIER
jgi:hypothetical protein